MAMATELLFGYQYKYPRRRYILWKWLSMDLCFWCCSYILLGIIASVIVISLIPLYLSDRQISRNTDCIISMTVSYGTNLKGGSSLTIANVNAIANTLRKAYGFDNLSIKSILFVSSSTTTTTTNKRRRRHWRQRRQTETSVDSCQKTTNTIGDALSIVFTIKQSTPCPTVSSKQKFISACQAKINASNYILNLQINFTNGQTSSVDINFCVFATLNQTVQSTSSVAQQQDSMSVVTSSSSTVSEQMAASVKMISVTTASITLSISQTTVQAETTPVDLQTTAVGLQTTPVGLQTTAEDLQTTPVDLQTTAVGLQTTPVDLQTTAGDLQTTAGDLQTTAGDLQTTAGDLQTTAGDLQTTAGEVDKTVTITSETTIITTSITTVITATVVTCTSTTCSIRGTCTDTSSGPLCSCTSGLYGPGQREIFTTSGDMIDPPTGTDTTLGAPYIDAVSITARGLVTMVSFYANNGCVDSGIQFGAFSTTPPLSSSNTFQLVTQSGPISVDRSSYSTSMQRVDISLCLSSNNPVGCKGNAFVIEQGQYFGSYASSCRFAYSPVGSSGYPTTYYKYTYNPFTSNPSSAIYVHDFNNVVLQQITIAQLTTANCDDPCQPNPCDTNAICTSGITYSCACKSGYTGSGTIGDCRKPTTSTIIPCPSNTPFGYVATPNGQPASIGVTYIDAVAVNTGGLVTQVSFYAAQTCKDINIYFGTFSSSGSNQFQLIEQSGALTYDRTSDTDTSMKLVTILLCTSASTPPGCQGNAFLISSGQYFGSYSSQCIWGYAPVSSSSVYPYTYYQQSNAFSTGAPTTGTYSNSYANIVLQYINIQSTIFEQYQKARLTFVQSVADLATRPQNIETLQNAGVMALLRPLLLDVVPSVQQTAALALGRLANYSDHLAESVVRGDILPQLVYSLADQNRFYKKAAAFVLRAVAKHSPQLAQSVIDCGALDALVLCLEEFDPSVKEAATWALGYIARHNAELAQHVVDAGGVPLLVLCLQEPEIALKRVAASALSDIAKHSPELAQTVVDAGAIAHLAQMILNPDAQLKRQIFSALSQIAKHSVDLAEMVVEAEIFPAAFACLNDTDEYVKKNCATLIREIVKHTPELAQMIVNAGGVAAVVDYVSSTRGNVRLPGVMMLGYTAAHTESLAMAVIVSKGINQLSIALNEETEDHILAATAWALGQIGRHTPEHAKAVAVANVLPRLLHLYMRTDMSENLQTKAKKALKNILQKCVYLPVLEPLLHEASPNILKHVVAQFS
ncbi:unnamed protein product, partial [Adineta steineri]